MKTFKPFPFPVINAASMYAVTDKRNLQVILFPSEQGARAWAEVLSFMGRGFRLEHGGQILSK